MEIKTITRRQYRTSADQRMQIVEQFRRSGLTRAAFSRQSGVPLPTLGYWLTKAKRSSNLPALMTFSEIRLAAPDASPPNNWAMEVVGPDGVMVRCREPLPVQDLAWLLRNR